MNPVSEVLIVEDEADVRSFLRPMLEELGYRVHEAVNGAEGLAACEAHRPDIVLMDVRMPGMDGLETCARMQEQESTRDIPVIFISGLMNLEEKLKAFRAGGVDYITKPFRMEEVAVRLRTHLSLVKQQKELQTQNRTLAEALKEAERLNLRLLETNERLRLSEELKGHFLSNMRNEINNPLNAILSLSMELERGEVPPHRTGEIGTLVASEASDLDFQIRNIFGAAALEAGEAFPAPAEVDVCSVVTAAMDAQRYQARRKAVGLRFKAPPAGLLFCTDAEKLYLVLSNLISNGIRFGPEGGQVWIELEVLDGQLCLRVRDEGPGIRPEDQARIWERFRQLETGSSRSHQGQGLGLSVVKSMVELLGGRITLSDEPGRGATFVCLLPELAAAEFGATEALDGNLFFFPNGEEA